MVGPKTFLIALNLVVIPGDPTLLVGLLMLNFLIVGLGSISLIALDPFTLADLGPLALVSLEPLV